MNKSEWIDKQIPTILSKNAFRIKISLNTYDAESITQAYCYLVSGVCFSLALKYAGTWNEQTANIIVNFISEKMIDDFFFLSFFLREIILNNFKFISIVRLIMWKMIQIVMHRIVLPWNLFYQHWFFRLQWFEKE